LNRIESNLTKTFQMEIVLYKLSFFEQNINQVHVHLNQK